jgi:hypothetical protein
VLGSIVAKVSCTESTPNLLPARSVRLAPRPAFRTTKRERADQLTFLKVRWTIASFAQCSICKCRTE